VRSRQWLQVCSSTANTNHVKVLSAHEDTSSSHTLHHRYASNSFSLLVPLLQLEMIRIALPSFKLKCNGSSPHSHEESWSAFILLEPKLLMV
jgi:hypothetical protein